MCTYGFFTSQVSWKVERGKRATDPIWSLKVYNVQNSVTKPSEPVLYYLQDGPKRRFVREELLVVPFKSEFHPENQ